MFTVIATPNNGADVVLTQPAEIMLNMEHVMAELAAHVQPMHGVFTQITQRILGRSLQRRNHIAGQETGIFRSPLAIPLALKRRRRPLIDDLISGEARHAAFFIRGGIGRINERLPL